jgi:hypothetical protein
MRFFEMIAPQPPGLASPDVPQPITIQTSTSALSTGIKDIGDLLPKRSKSTLEKSYNINGIEYAAVQPNDEVALKIKELLVDQFPNVAVRVQFAKPNDNKLVPHIRILNALPKSTVIDLLKKNGLVLRDPDSVQLMISDTYQSDTYSLKNNNNLFTIVIAGKGSTQKTGEGCQVGPQQLRPEKFKLLGWTGTRIELASKVKEELPNVIGPDQQLLNGLSQLVDVALGEKENVDPQAMSWMSGCIKLISQDFGEILTPIVITKGSQPIKFSPKSNEPLIDVTINGQDTAVKSLSGSGNSFMVIKDQIDQYEKEMASLPGNTLSVSLKVLKDFVSSDGRTTDKLIRAAKTAGIPEYQSLIKILGVSEINNYSEMESAVANFVKKLQASGSDALYSRYLQAVLPAALSSGRTTKQKENRKSKTNFLPKLIPVGMPADYKKYIRANTEDDVGIQSSRSAGKKKFDANFVRAASRQLTYMLGMGFRNQVVEGEMALEMETTITNIMKRRKAIAAWIIINSNGTISVQQRSFENAKFGYQYHAGTDTVNQNAPGFHIRFF